MVTAGTQTVVLGERVQRAHPSSGLYVSWICLQLRLDHITFLRASLSRQKMKDMTKSTKSLVLSGKPQLRSVKAAYEHPKLVGIEPMLTIDLRRAPFRTSIGNMHPCGSFTITSPICRGTSPQCRRGLPPTRNLNAETSSASSYLKSKPSAPTQTVLALL